MKKRTAIKPGDVINYHVLKSSAGGSGTSGGNGGFREGQSLICQVVGREPGGYAVIIKTMTLKSQHFSHV